MSLELEKFLNHHHPLVEESEVWAGGLLPLRVTSHLGQEQPPLDYVTSVRAVLLRDNSVLVVRSADNCFHVTPGGRREKGESLETTLRREVLEETGWTIKSFSPLGFVHFHHLASRLPDYRYPHPDFVQLIYVATAGEYVPGAQQFEEDELETDFHPISDIARFKLKASQQLFLDAALSVARP